jgi:hypothetical protein
VWCVILGALLLLLLWKDVWLSEEMGGLARLDIEGLMTSKTRNWELPPVVFMHPGVWHIQTRSLTLMWWPSAQGREVKEHSRAFSLSPMSRYMGRVNWLEVKSPSPPPCRFSPF